MEWMWKRLAHYVGRAKLQVEFEGISEEALTTMLRQEAVKRLEWVEQVVFSEELDDQEKIKTLQEWFLMNMQ